jgi:hypothetical protein
VRLSEQTFDRLFFARTHTLPIHTGPAGAACGVLGGEIEGAPSGPTLLLRLDGAFLGRRDRDLAILLEPDEFRATLVSPPHDTPHRGGVPLRRGRLRRERTWLRFDPEQGALLSKLGGRPAYIQHELFERRLVTERRLEFAFQFEASALPKPSALSPVLCDGAVYVFAPRRERGFGIEQGFVEWQR